MLDILFAGELNIDAIMGGVKQMPVFGKAGGTYAHHF